MEIKPHVATENDCILYTLMYQERPTANPMILEHTVEWGAMSLETKLSDVINRKWVPDRPREITKKDENGDDVIETVMCKPVFEIDKKLTRKNTVVLREKTDGDIIIFCKDILPDKMPQIGYYPKEWVEDAFRKQSEEYLAMNRRARRWELAINALVLFAFIVSISIRLVK